MKASLLIVIILALSSCGKKGVVMEPTSMGIVDSLKTKSEAIVVKEVSEQVCIDDLLKTEMNEKEKIRRVLTNTDISYCNGMRVRLKVFKMKDGNLRVYGMADSSSGKRTCLRDGADFKRKSILGNYEGSLIGDGIKISLSGHEYTSDNEIIKRKGSNLYFEDQSFKGDMGFFENNELVCTSMP